MFTYMPVYGMYYQDAYAAADENTAAIEGKVDLDSLGATNSDLGCVNCCLCILQALFMFAYGI